MKERDVELHKENTYSLVENTCIQPMGDMQLILAYDIEGELITPCMQLISILDNINTVKENRYSSVEMWPMGNMQVTQSYDIDGEFITTQHANTTSISH